MDRTFRDAGTEVIGLDGVEEQVKTYGRRGFVDIARIPVMVCSASDARRAVSEYTPNTSAENFKDISSARPEHLAHIDTIHTGLERSTYWLSSSLLTRADVFGYTYSLKPDPNSEPTGFVLVRGCQEGHRIGPLYAPNAAIATHLLYLAMLHPNIANSDGSLAAEGFGANKEARKVFEGMGWTRTGVEYHRMWYEGRVPRPQGEGGLGMEGMFAGFDAGCG